MYFHEKTNKLTAIVCLTGNIWAKETLNQISNDSRGKGEKSLILRATGTIANIAMTPRCEV